jgi:hypothetical protein
MANNSIDNMKKVFLTILPIFLFLFSCEGDDELSFVQENYIIGKWFVNEIGTINANNTIVYEDYINDSDCEADHLVLNQEGTYEENDFEFISSSCQNDQITGTYVLDNNKIVKTYVDSEGITKQRVLSIISLTYEEINVSYTNSETNTLVFLKLRK